jgi:hypothetical protein
MAILQYAKTPSLRLPEFQDEDEQEEVGPATLPVIHRLNGCFSPGDRLPSWVRLFV